jgi:hypothetical protein
VEAATHGPDCTRRPRGCNRRQRVERGWDGKLRR